MIQWLGLIAQQQPPPDMTGALAGGLIFTILYLGLIIVAIAGIWKTFSKAGKPGWASIIPIYNVVVLLEIVGKPIWWILLLFIPFVNFLIAILIALDVARVFGRGAGFGLGIAFLPFIFYPILGFGSARYRGPAAA